MPLMPNFFFFLVFSSFSVFKVLFCGAAGSTRLYTFNVAMICLTVACLHLDDFWPTSLSFHLKLCHSLAACISLPFSTVQYDDVAA